MSDGQPANQDEKLKNLSESLSEELGSDATNVQIPKSSFAPTPASAAPPASTSSSTSMDDLNLEDLDKILNEQDPTFNKNMDELKLGLATTDKSVDLQSMELDANLLKDTANEIEDKEVIAVPENAKPSIVSKTISAVSSITDASLQTAAKAKAIGQGAVPLAKGGLSVLLQHLRAFFQWLMALSLFKKVNFFLFVITSIALIVVLGRTIRGEKFLKPSESPFLRTFEQVATRIELLKEDEPFEQFDNPLRNPEYVVLFKKMFVNLKAIGSSRNPMAAFEVFIEANTQEAAIELKDREKQFKDVIARVFEAMPYDEIKTPEGKNKLKLIIRRDLNQVINKGRVKKVYFKTFFYKS